jgi:hypothetical protein
MRLLFVVVAVLLSCSPPIDPTFTNVQDQVFKVSCAFAACHKGQGADGLNLEPPAHAKIVNVATQGFDGGTLVVPSKPDESYLYLKLTLARPPLGQRMPPASDGLEPVRLELVRAWIAAGAQNN